MKHYQLKSNKVEMKLNALTKNYAFDIALNEAAHRLYDQTPDDGVIPVEIKFRTRTHRSLKLTIEIPKRRIARWDDGLRWFSTTDLKPSFQTVVFVELADGTHHFAESSALGSFKTIDPHGAEIVLTDVTRFAFCHWAWFGRHGFPESLCITERELKELHFMIEKLKKHFREEDDIKYMERILKIERNRIENRTIRSSVKS